MIILALLGVLSFFVVRPFLMALFFGLLLAYLFRPLYNLFLKKIKNKTLTALLICILILVVILIPMVFFTKSLVQESYSIYVLAKDKLATGIFTDCENSFCLAIQDLWKDSLNIRIEELTHTITNWVINQGSLFLLAIPIFLLNIFVIFFTMFYSLKDGEKFTQKFNSYLKTYPGSNFLRKRFKDVINGVVLGYLVVAVIQGAIGGLIFFFFGISSPIFWGVVMAFMALIPYIGTGIIWVPAAIVILLNGIFQDSTILIVKGIGLFLAGFILISGADNLLRPKLMGHKAKIHPLVILLGLLGGIFLFGSVGVIVGPLILSLLVLAIEVYVITNKRIKD